MISSLCNLNKIPNKSFIGSICRIQNSFCRHFSSTQIDQKKIQENVERFHSHKLYLYDMPIFLDNQREFQDRMEEYNRTFPTEVEKRSKMLQKVFAEVGENCCVETPLNSNWGCKHVHLGKAVYINSNCTFVDDDHIYIGDYTMVAPNVVFTTAGHPILPSLRLKGYEFVFPINVGKNVWIGSGCQIMPGVTIGDNTVIGAGSVVTRDIPANCVAMGVPCKVVREIGEKDRKYYFRDHEIDVPL